MFEKESRIKNHESRNDKTKNIGTNTRENKYFGISPKLEEGL
jgi:hypothetical protein